MRIFINSNVYSAPPLRGVIITPFYVEMEAQSLKELVQG